MDYNLVSLINIVAAFYSLRILVFNINSKSSQWLNMFSLNNFIVSGNDIKYGDQYHVVPKFNL